MSSDKTQRFSFPTLYDNIILWSIRRAALGICHVVLYRLKCEKLVSLVSNIMAYYHTL